MHPLRSARFPAILLLLAAIGGLITANTPAGVAATAVKDAHVVIPGILDLSVGHVVSDGLLAVFFFVAAVELQFELTAGQLRSARTAAGPAIAALGGVVAPIALYSLVAGGGEAAAGWPIPTATDIAFALGVLAVFGTALPRAVRVFLLALAILDDIVGIVFIAVLFTTDLDLGMLGLALVGLVVFRVLSGRLEHGRWVVAALVAVGLVTWYLVYAGGVHPTIAGVALGLVMVQSPALRARHALEPWVNGAILPLFAFSAALVVVPQVSPRELSPAFWGVVLALPLGKILGITAGGWLSQRLAPAEARLAFGDLLAAGALGGIGFTVSLLLAALAFAGDTRLADQATLGVLAGSLISLVAAALLVSWRAWHHRRARTT